MDFISFSANVGTAFVFGVLVGLERELRNHEAGLRTNALVAFGAALFVSLARWCQVEGDPTRIAGQIVTGVGFLAGGVIIRDGLNIRGLNTAGTLWCTAAIGTLAGSGFLAAAAFGTAVILFLNTVLRPFANQFDSWVRKIGLTTMSYRLTFVVSDKEVDALRSVVLSAVEQRLRITLIGLRLDNDGKTGDAHLVAEVTAFADQEMEQLMAAVATAPGVSSAGWERHLT